jgi:AAA+ ATPase superfamily predicted ATPase
MSIMYCPNPFCLEPTTARAQFFGRQREIRQVLNLLHNGQSVSIVGPTRIGKTSLLAQIAQRYVRIKHGLAEGRIFICLDSRSLANLDQALSFRLIRQETIRQIKDIDAVKAIGDKLEQVVQETSSKTAHFGLWSLMRSATADGLQFVTVLDNLDELNQNHLLETEFFSALRALSTSFQVAYLVASQISLDKLERICPEGPGSPFFNIFQPIPIGCFTTEESRDLVVTLSQSAGADFPEFIIDYILEIGYNEPYRLQRAGFVAFEVWQENEGSWRSEHLAEIRRRFEEIAT